MKRYDVFDWIILASLSAAILDVLLDPEPTTGQKAFVAGLALVGMCLRRYRFTRQA